MADFSYLPLGWTCQQLANNAAGQNLGYDMHAPTFPGHPSVLPTTGEADHMIAGGPTGSVGGPHTNAQMRPAVEEVTENSSKPAGKASSPKASK